MKNTIRILILAISGVIFISFLFYIHSEVASKTKKGDFEQKINERELPLKGKTIVLDPGHGGKDVGSIGNQGTYEKDVTLPMALKVGQKLAEQGATIIMTRQSDTTVSWDARTKMAESNDADLFISIHFDSFKSSNVSGMTTYYYKTQDQLFAQIIHDQLVKADNQSIDRGVMFGDYHVLRENAKPAVLLELGFISNKNEETRMKTDAFQDDVATSITRGVVNCFK